MPFSGLTCSIERSVGTPLSPRLKGLAYAPGHPGWAAFGPAARQACILIGEARPLALNASSPPTSSLIPPELDEIVFGDLAVYDGSLREMVVDDLINLQASHLR